MCVTRICDYICVTLHPTHVRKPITAFSPLPSLSGFQLNWLTCCRRIKATFFFISGTFCFTSPFQPRQLPLSLSQELLFLSPPPIPQRARPSAVSSNLYHTFGGAAGRRWGRQWRKCKMLMLLLLTAALSAPFCTYMIMKQFALNLHLFKF